MEIFFQLTLCQKELSFQTVRVSKEIEVHSPEPPELQQLSLDTLMTERRLESDFHPEPERPLSELAELWLEYALVDKEPISHSSRPTTLGTRLRVRESTGQELEVLP